MCSFIHPPSSSCSHLLFYYETSTSFLVPFTVSSLILLPPLNLLRSYSHAPSTADPSPFFTFHSTCSLLLRAFFLFSYFSSIICPPKIHFPLIFLSPSRSPCPIPVLTLPLASLRSSSSFLLPSLIYLHSPRVPSPHRNDQQGTRGHMPWIVVTLSCGRGCRWW